MRTEERIVKYICDRCGAVSDKRDLVVGLFQRRRLLLGAMWLVGLSEASLNKEYDLCEKCRESLKKWLNDKGEK